MGAGHSRRAAIRRLCRDDAGGIRNPFHAGSRNWLAPGTPRVGHGYATEAAQSVLRHAFTRGHLKQIVSFTVPANQPSQAVMQRLGMTTRADDNFAHPRLPPGHPLCQHLLYRLHYEQWLLRQQ